MLLCASYERFIVLNSQQYIFKFQRTLRVWVVRRFFSRERSVEAGVLDVEGFASSFDNPHRDFRVGEAGLVEVKYEFFTELIVHVILWLF